MLFVFQKLHIEFTIREISPDAFDGIPNLEILQMTYCSLTEAPNLLFVEKMLKVINFDCNNISFLPPSYFAGCLNLNFIHLNRNHLKAMPNLEAVSQTIIGAFFNFNYIYDLSLFYGIRFPKLYSIGLGHNSIYEFDFVNQMRLFPTLKYLFLISNQLKSMDEFRVELHSGLYIVLDDNPWHCNDSLAWIVSSTEDLELGVRVFGFVELRAEDRMTCWSPPTLREIPLWELGTHIVSA